LNVDRNKDEDLRKAGRSFLLPGEV